jgi:hypothetical protein
MVRLGNTFRSPCNVAPPLVLRAHMLDYQHDQEFMVRVSRGIAQGVELCNRTICPTDGGGVLDSVVERVSPISC